MDQDKWEKLAREIFSGMKDWRAQNPKATFVAIEDKVDEMLADLRVKMMEDTALESQARDLLSGYDEKRVHCTICGRMLQDKGKQTRKLTAHRDKQVCLERSYGYCPTCQVGFFPPR
jgi:hypothetical protein